MNRALARRIALAYDELAVYNPRARSSWDCMAGDEARQFDWLGIEVEAWYGEGQPYAGSAEMRASVRAGHLYVFAGGSPHPCRTPAEVFRGRAVHDVYGHALTGADYSLAGELAAFRAHVRMYRAASIPALVCDNLGQTCWYYAHPSNEGKAHGERAWPEQKVDYLPPELWQHLLRA